MSVFHFGFCTLHLSCLPDFSVEKIMYLQRIVNFSSHSLTKTVWSHIHDSIALTCVPWFVWCVCQVGKIMFYNCNNKILHMWIKNFCQICAKSQTRKIIVWSNYSKSIFFKVKAHLLQFANSDPSTRIKQYAGYMEDPNNCPDCGNSWWFKMK